MAKHLLSFLFKKKQEKNIPINNEHESVNIPITLTDEDIVMFVNKEIEYRISQNEDFESIDDGERDELFEDAARIIVATQQGSTSLLQRKLKLGYNRAGRIIDQLESAGIVGPFEGSRAREVKIKDEVTLEQILYIDEKKSNYFTNDILPLHENYINQQVESYLKEVEEKNIFNEKKLLKQEIIEKEQAIIEKERIKNLKENVLKELIEEGLVSKQLENDFKRRELISQDVQDRVWNRDGGKCVNCGSSDKLEFDHIIPFSKGGSNTYRNIQLLCEKCNRQKSNKIG